MMGQWNKLKSPTGRIWSSNIHSGVTQTESSNQDTSDHLQKDIDFVFVSCWDFNCKLSLLWRNSHVDLVHGDVKAKTVLSQQTPGVYST